MKKRLILAAMLCMACVCSAGCSSKNESKIETVSFKDEEEAVILPEPPPDAPAKADVDLTRLSSTMVYAEVANIMSDPIKYIGKVIKMRGPYAASYYDETEMYYHYVIIEDAAACCQSGLEFIWEGDHSYPDEYPERDTVIELIGEFKSYDELGRTYYYIAVKDILL